MSERKKGNEIAREWIENHTHQDNKDDLLMIGELGAKALNDKLRLGMGEDGSGDLTMCVYLSILQSAIDVLVSKTSTHKSFEINLGNRLLLSFDNDDVGEDVEKVGNFMIYFKHIALNSIEKFDGVENDRTIELCAKWNAANIIESTSTVKEIADKSLEAIRKNCGAVLKAPEVVLPMFGIVHDCLITFGKLKLAEIKDSSYELDVIGIFEIKFEEVDGEEPIIAYTPQPTVKLDCKNDAKAQEQQVE